MFPFESHSLPISDFTEPKPCPLRKVIKTTPNVFLTHILGTVSDGALWMSTQNDTESMLLSFFFTKSMGVLLYKHLGSLGR